MRTMRRPLVVGLLAALCASALITGAAFAHPLGNFTINHYSGLRVAPDAVVIDHVTDYAEIPTFTERRLMDTDGNGDVSDAEAAIYKSAQCRSLASDLDLKVGNSAVTLALTESGIGFPMGQGSPTMRLVCVYRGAVSSPITEATAFSFADNSYAERRGWREITVEGDGTTLTASDAPSTGTSNRLTVYPADLLAIPLGQSATTFTAQPAGPRLAPLSLPDAQPIAAVIPEPQPANGQPPGTTTNAPVSVPAGVTDLGNDVTSLFQAPDLTPPVVALGLLVAFGLGALHAVSPGHGKTVMAAYLVGSRGTARHALGLGLTVTVSHTLGVLALGALSLSAAAFISPDRLYPILSIVSGGIVVAIGAYLLLTRLRTMWATDKERHAADLHQHHDHDHDHGHGHHHEPPPERPAGWHEHDGMGHTHLPPANAMGWRGLFALGLSGGMIPSISALLVLIGSISIGRPIYGVVLTVAFGLGMAFVLVGVGFGLVYARRLVERLPVAAPLRLTQRLPLVTAVIVLLAGVLITGQGLATLG